MTRLACLPLDDRPVNYDYLRLLGQVAGYEVALPPREWLGNPWRASRHADLVAWLSQAAAQADAVIVAIDTLAYGGLIPSRTSMASTESVLANLAGLQALKAARPQLPILASSVILRISRANSAEEEKAYWATYGSRMFRLSYLEHKSTLGEASGVEQAERNHLRAEVPDDVYADYRQGRARNHAVNRAMLDWLADGLFDYLLLPQDDTAAYGWNIAEARSLQSLIRQRGLTDRAITYPGADEIGCLLLARYVCQQAGLAPRVWPRYSSVNGAQALTAYEDRPVQELLKAHLAPLNGHVAESPAESDLWLFLNAPAEVQGAGDLQWVLQHHPHLAPPDQALADTRREMTSPRRSPEEFVRALRAALRHGQPVALADVAFVNGADLTLGRLLVNDPSLSQLASYGGWNTAGNTLGLVLAHSLIRLAALRGANTPPQQAAHFAFLFLRLLDDYYYQAIERSRLAYEDLPALGLAPTHERLSPETLAALQPALTQRLTYAAQELRDLFVRSGSLRDVQVSNIDLPWQRLFEIGFDLQVQLS